jgi:Asp-tRNA(Asn)/Glu-tRNA(Gln) amidotransferase A subunit family amidase
MLARSPRDVELVLAALTASPGPNSPPAATPAAAQIVFARTPCWDAVEPEARHAIERIVSSLGLREVVLPESFVALVEAQTTIQSYEAARALAAERASSPELLSDWLRTALAEADELVPADYEAARTVAERDGPRVNDVLRSHGAILVPSATGVPPLGLHQTGDPLFCRVWTLIGAPSLSLPLAWTDDGLPAGLQLVGARGSDRALLAAAVRLGLGSD